MRREANLYVEHGRRARCSRARKRRRELIEARYALAVQPKLR
jgi:hypothetical protein